MTAAALAEQCGDTLWGSSKICTNPRHRVVLSTGRVREYAQCLRCMAHDQGRCWSCGKPREDVRHRVWFCETCAEARLKDSNRIAREKADARARKNEMDRKRRAERKAAGICPKTAQSQAGPA